MLYVQGVLGSLAALILAMFVPSFWTALQGISREKATGLAAVAGGLAEAVLSPRFLILFLLLLTVFYLTGHLGNRALRIVFFWIPAITTCVMASGMWILIRHALMHVRNQ
jgi:hypothetical protein